MRIPRHLLVPLLFMVICALESYLWRTNTSLMFVLFNALLYATPLPRHEPLGKA